MTSQKFLQKTLILASVLASAASYATSLYPELSNAKRATLETVELDKEYKFHSKTGMVEMTDKEILVFAFFAAPCNAGGMCSRIAMAPRTFRAPITNVQESCGSKYYTATSDKRPVDGTRIDITVVDNSASFCNIRQESQLEVHVTEQFPRSNDTLFSTMSSKEGFPGAKANRIVLKNGENDVAFDTVNEEKVFGAPFSFEAGIVEKTAQKHLKLEIKPHTIYCAQMIGFHCPVAQTFIADLPIVQLDKQGSKDACGSKLTIAQGQLKLANGQMARATLTVQDNSTRICEDYRPNLTEINLDVELANGTNKPAVSHNSFGSAEVLK